MTNQHLHDKISDDLSNTNRYLEALTQEQAQYSQMTRSEILQIKTDITTLIHEAQARQGRQGGRVSSDPLLLLPGIQESLANLVKATQAVTQEDVILQKLWFTELGGREHTVEMPHEQTFRWLLYDSELQDSNSQDSEGENQCSGRVSTNTMSSDQDSCSEQNAGSDHDDDAISFQTAPDGDNHSVSDAPGYLGTHDETSALESSNAPNFLEWPEQSSEVAQKERELRDQKRESFLNWLRTEDGIFYCSGKAGSGKSTLMKFLASETKTRDELSLWSRSEGKTLVLASFFFWSSGTPLQRSLEGLYRQILWEILRKFPSLIPVVFPSAWSSIGVGSPSVTDKPFTMDELESAVDRLLREAAVTSSHRLCLFIDGLDEYEGDYWKLSRAISRWAASSKDIKFCLSSRPHRVFLRHFALDDARHLKLHELTRRDMYKFVSDQFRHDERYTAIEDDISQEIDLLGSLVDRSDGVFLWVRLVTVELLTGMGNDCSVRQLFKRLDSIPNDLGNMFQQMLKSIDSSEQQRAAEMFLTMTTVQDPWNWSKKVIMQAILDDLMDDPQLAESLLSGNVGPYLSPGECIRKCHVAGPRAITRCKGLIEVTRTSNNFPECHEFSFIHRTVGDFMKDADIQSWLKITAGDFCPYRRLCHAALGCFKFINMNPSKFPECPDYEPHRRPGSAASESSVTQSSESPAAIVTIEQSFLIDTLLFTIRNAESDGILHLAVEVEAMTSMLREAVAKTHNHGSTSKFLRPRFRLNAQGVLPDRDLVPIATECLHSAVVSYSMCRIGMTETVFELASRQPNILVPSPGSHVFLSAALTDLSDVFNFGQDARRTRSLIGQASSSINADCSELCKIGGWERTIPGPRVSTWSAFLLALSQLLGTRKPNTKSNLAGISTQLELFLKHGADPNVIFIGYQYSLEASTNDVESLAPPLPQGPLYADLLDMITFWRLVPTNFTLNMLNVARQQQRGGWLHRSLHGFPWVGRQVQDAYKRMSPLDDNTGGHFFPLSISTYGSLGSISWEALHETASWISEHGGSMVFLIIDV